jgi:hypothetical protein
MATDWEAPRVVSARRDIAAEPETIFELIAQVSADLARVASTEEAAFGGAEWPFCAAPTAARLETGSAEHARTRNSSSWFCYRRRPGLAGARTPASVCPLGRAVRWLCDAQAGG